ncbi:MAG: hypothetical protein RLY31_618 [Bacteroidota bacterium]|jgi:rod shape-determining protein MreC
MLQLLQLLLRFSGLFVFLLLELVCFSMVVKYNQRQSSVYLNTVNRFSGTIQEKTAAVYQYLQLYDENIRLARENARLLALVANTDKQGSPAEPDGISADSSLRRYQFQPAKVIRNSINQHHNYLILDKGLADGVVPHSGVVTDMGVVGIVRDVSEHYCVVMSLLHRQAKVSARIRDKGFFGPLTWRDTNPWLFTLDDIPKHAPVAKSDTIETSGYSSLFPPGLMIGVVDRLSMAPGSNFFNITVRSSLDMSNLQHVYIVKNLLAAEQDALERSAAKSDE